MNKPIAIVGLACRFPGEVQNPDDFWQLLLEDRDAVTEVPAARLDTTGRLQPSPQPMDESHTFAPEVIDTTLDFDAGFFGISSCEAAHMPPQQRLLLELAWETFENAGIVPRRMAGSRCAVYIGISNHEHGDRTTDDSSAMDACPGIGNTTRSIANRISSQFDLHAPSLSIETACAASLVALHQARAALQAGEAELALAGGDGYVRAEGGGLVLLKPLDAALRDGDTIHAVIADSGVNSDGHTQEGISIPVAIGQAERLMQVYTQARIDPADPAYVDAHGVATATGDPIEARASSTAIDPHRRAGRPPPIGSVKGHIGHLEAASGIAGLLKAILSLKHRILPPPLHYQPANPPIDFARNGLRAAADASAPIPMIGINTFGFDGTHAHVLL